MLAPDIPRVTSLLARREELRVLYSFPYRLGMSGIGTTAWHQAQGLASLRVRLRVVCPNLARPLSPAIDVAENLTLGPLRVPQRLVGKARALAWHDRHAARMLRRHHREIDVVHAWPTAMLRTARVARDLGVPLVREAPNAHTAFAFDVVTRESERLGLTPPPDHCHTFDPVKLRTELEEFRLAQWILVPSEFVERTFLEQGVPKAKLKIHQYGFDPERFHPPSVMENPSMGDHESLSVAFVGRCEPRKGLHHALRAWIDSGAADRGRFRICGEFQPGYADALGSLLDHPSVEILGFVPDPAEILRQSTALILPALEEGSALVTYEARASGCLLVVSDASGARCEHLKHGLVHPAGDVEELTAQLAFLSANPSEVARMRRQALQDVESLTWRAAAERLLGIYRECIDASQGAPPRS